jgi:hypothetical protein
MKLILFCFVGLISYQILAQDLMVERIRKISSKKKSVYFNKGIFHNGAPAVKAVLKKVRHSFVKKNGYERIVFDFSSNKLPRIYGHVSKSEKRLYLDFFKTNLDSAIGSFGNSKYVDSINFFPIDKQSLSVELIYKENVKVEVFYLDSPARLVVDIRG